MSTAKGRTPQGSGSQRITPSSIGLHSAVLTPALRKASPVQTLQVRKAL
jgi:hypothetical protein